MVGEMIIVTDSAKIHILNMLKELNCSILFFGLQGGGCAGFEYFWKPMDDAEYAFQGDEEDQKIILDNDHSIMIDYTTIDKLTGSIIDYKKDFIGSQLTVNNPNAKGGCGCGTSISL